MWKVNVLGDIFNAGGNDKYQEYYGFTASFFKKIHTVIDEITKNKLVNRQLGNFIYQRDEDNIDKEADERSQIDVIEDNK